MARRKRQEVEIERTRLLILEAAARVFARHGYRASSMAAIAAEAGYTAPTLYTYVNGKAELFDDLVGQVLMAVSDVYAEREPSGMSFEQRLELLLLRLLKVVDLHSDAFAFFLTLGVRGETGPTNSRKRSTHHGEELAVRQRMIDWLNQNLTGTKYAPLGANLVETYINGVLTGFVGRWAEGDRSSPTVEMAPVLVPLVLGGLAHLVDIQGKK